MLNLQPNGNTDTVVSDLTAGPIVAVRCGTAVITNADDYYPAATIEAMENCSSHPANEWDVKFFNDYLEKNNE